MAFDEATHTQELRATVGLHLFDGLHRIQGFLQGHPDVQDAQSQALQAGVPWLTIITTLLPFVFQILAGGKIDWQAIVAAILALINPPPTPLHVARNSTNS